MACDHLERVEDTLRPHHLHFLVCQELLFSCFGGQLDVPGKSQPSWVPQIVCQLGAALMLDPPSSITPLQEGVKGSLSYPPPHITVPHHSLSRDSSFPHVPLGTWATVRVLGIFRAMEMGPNMEQTEGKEGSGQKSTAANDASRITQVNQTGKWRNWGTKRESGLCSNSRISRVEFSVVSGPHQYQQWNE